MRTLAHLASVTLSIPLALLVLSGCLASSDDEGGPALPGPAAFRGEATAQRLPAPDHDFSTAIDEDHGGLHHLHAVPALHEGSFGMELVGYNPLTRPMAGDNPAGADSGYGAIDTWENLVCVAHFAGATGAGGGATIVDIADPANPVVLSSVLSGALNSDCQFTDDGKFLLLATYTGAGDGLPLLPPPAGDAGSNGVNVYDVSDPKNPRFLLHDNQGATVTALGPADLPVSDSYHNVFTAQINGTHYVFQTYSNNVLALESDGSGLEVVSQLNHSNHDFWVGRHPITGGWMAVTGGPDRGTAIFDVDDPANPELLGVWEADRPNRTTGWHRQWPLENTVNGRALMVVAGEECRNGDTLPYTVVDWTDATNITTVGQWWIPGHPGTPELAEPHLCEMNSHEFEVFDGYVATGNYHAGVWVFDVGSPERAAEPVTIGYYLPHEVPQMSGGTVNAPFVWSPDVWGAYFDERGYVIAADWYSGLYVLDIGIAKTE